MRAAGRRRASAGRPHAFAGRAGARLHRVCASMHESSPRHRGPGDSLPTLQASAQPHPIEPALPCPPHRRRRRMVWLSARDPKCGYSCEFPAISLHAISSDTESFNRPCLYLQLDQGDEEDLEEEDDEEEAPLPELRLIPADATQREPAWPMRPPTRREG